MITHIDQAWIVGILRAMDPEYDSRTPDLQFRAIQELDRILTAAVGQGWTAPHPMTPQDRPGEVEVIDPTRSHPYGVVIPPEEARARAMYEAGE